MVRDLAPNLTPNQVRSFVLILVDQYKASSNSDWGTTSILWKQIDQATEGVAVFDVGETAIHPLKGDHDRRFDLLLDATLNANRGLFIAVLDSMPESYVQASIDTLKKKFPSWHRPTRRRSKEKEFKP